MRLVLQRCLRGIFSLMVAVALVTILTGWLEKSHFRTFFRIKLIELCGLVFATTMTFIPLNKHIHPHWISSFTYVLGLVAFIPFAFMFSVFGIYDFGSLVTVLRDNPPSAMLWVGIGTLLEPIIEFAAIFVLLLFGGIYFARRVPHFSKIILTFGVVLIAVSPFTKFMYRMVVPDPRHALVSIPDDFQEPTITRRPEIKKNIIFVYLESLERTYLSVPELAHALAPISQLDDEGLSFDNVVQVYGTEFTIAGMVATQCGVPLVQNGIMNIRKIGRPTNFDPVGFMDHIRCLGDILAAEGYIGSYINGSNLAVFNKGQFFQAHGHERVFGVNSLPGSRANVYENSWGLSDASVFEYAHAELEYLVGLGKPFTLSVLTLSTHGPDAELDPGCDYPVLHGSQIPAAIQCTGDHLQKMIDKVEDLGISEDTVLVVLSDHLAMRNSVYDMLELHGENRRNLVTIIDTGRQGVVSKEGSMLDVYPTILEVMGYQIADRRANLGISLLSDTTTLVEKTGQSALSSAFKQNQHLQKFLWDFDYFTGTIRQPHQNLEIQNLVHD